MALLFDKEVQRIQYFSERGKIKPSRAVEAAPIKVTLTHDIAVYFFFKEMLLNCLLSTTVMKS